MTQNPGIVQRQPAIAAGTITAVVALGLYALFLVSRDLGVIVPPDTREAITAFVVAGVAWGSAVWAQRRSTAMAAPKLVRGTEVEVLTAEGATLGHSTVEVPGE